MNRILLKKSHSKSKVNSFSKQRNYSQRKGERCDQIHLHGIYCPGNCPKNGGESANSRSYQRQVDGKIWSQEYSRPCVFCSKEQSCGLIDQGFQILISGISPSTINFPAVFILISSTLTPGALSNNLNPSCSNIQHCQIGNYFLYTFHTC